MRLKHLFFISIIFLSFNALSQDTLYIDAEYGASQPDDVDSSMIYHSIDVTFHNIDTLHWNQIHVELLEINSGQLMVREQYIKNNPNSQFEINGENVTIKLAMLPKSDYKIFAKVKHIGGVETETLETILNDE
tara:strand:- start:24460 stop:24858 length:399 start_codon:yes stop_codon:yes gene_type:complete